MSSVRQTGERLCRRGRASLSFYFLVGNLDSGVAARQFPYKSVELFGRDEERPFRPSQPQHDTAAGEGIGSRKRAAPHGDGHAGDSRYWYTAGGQIARTHDKRAVVEKTVFGTGDAGNEKHRSQHTQHPCHHIPHPQAVEHGSRRHRQQRIKRRAVDSRFKRAHGQNTFVKLIQFLR